MKIIFENNIDKKINIFIYDKYYELFINHIVQVVWKKY